ncbi:cation diffusion facilitator family transporter [Propionimicrobium lymphophilum]|uniref:cation diffusion facilitator family transporter n=1 Tax=Propionimicrobium lymphophilum TaxID=33012 RepID=UPI00254CB1E2|nr:cation diffusion facilitator family transporter [Propionimicrobium lymphophilum]MDK7709007.1 cation diffusion facilitator family transporter [Propionimicrobium lymphophilum]MDK7733046.1 cation diffusion facilitator family transporter [Propionimicrobium lymphophilum]
MNAPSSNRYAKPEDLTKFAWLSIAAALTTIVLKLTAAMLTNSVGLLSDAAESLVNLVAAVIALITLRIAIRPADDDHPFGHSKAEYFSAALEGVMIFVAAVFIIGSAIMRMFNPVMPEQLGIGLLINALAGVVNGAVALILYRSGKKHRSATLLADSKHLFTDVLTSIAVLLGVGLVAIFKMAILDAIVALLAGFNIIFMGIQIIKTAIDGLMDIALPEEVVKNLESVLENRREKDKTDFHAVRTREAGNRRFMNVHVLVPGEWSVKQGHDYVENLIDELVEQVPDLRVQAHLEPIGDPKSYEDINDI